ncbi:DUF664 domain-containing protein [Streptomyces venezuelae]|uniref:mycothiol transferase n=1 Tax=Streptomyces venezuelae TaxID=54571 RepID=UPI0034560148
MAASWPEAVTPSALAARSRPVPRRRGAPLVAARARRMIEEYARYNGHADLLRERIDRATGV